MTVWRIRRRLSETFFYVLFTAIVTSHKHIVVLTGELGFVDLRLGLCVFIFCILLWFLPMPSLQQCWRGIMFLGCPLVHSSVRLCVLVNLIFHELLGEFYHIYNLATEHLGTKTK